MRALARRLAPWVVGIALLVVVALRVPWAAFEGAIAHGPHAQILAANVVITLAIWGTDSLSTWASLAALRIARPLGEVVVVRGATYALVAINLALGHGGFGYYLYRSGEPAKRATGATLFLVGTNLAALLVATAIAWLAADVAPGDRALWWTLVIGCGGLALYLATIAARPRVLAGRAVLAPLFDAGLRGHALAIASRVPHVSAIVIGYYVAMRVWGVPVPISDGLLLMPGVVIAIALPISPGGLGTMQAAFVYFFAAYASDATADARAADVLAFSIVELVYGFCCSVAIGLACLPFARRLLPERAPA